jgi:hypothetical protein
MPSKRITDWKVTLTRSIGYSQLRKHPGLKDIAICHTPTNGFPGSYLY